MDPTHRQISLLTRIRTNIEAAFYWVRRVLGLLYSVLQRDSLGSLRYEIEQLSSAAVESTSYVGAELRSIDERLARLEGELVTVRELLEQQQPVGGRSPD